MSLTLDEYISDDSGSVQENGEVTEEQVEWQHIGQILPDKVSRQTRIEIKWLGNYYL